MKADGGKQEYDLHLLAHSPDLVVARFPLPRGVKSPRLPIELPAGSSSDGYFWASRPYTIYRFRGPEGTAIAHRFDAVADVRIEEQSVSYRDLALDWWILPDGTLVEEDRDEFAGLVARGVFSPEDADRAERAGRLLREHRREILDEVASIEKAIEGA